MFFLCFSGVFSLKGFRVDLSCKQLTVDFMNQSVLQISGQDVESKRSDKTDFAERLGAMNRRWQILQGRINERVRHRCCLEKEQQLLPRNSTKAGWYSLSCNLLMLTDPVPGEPFGNVAGVREQRSGPEVLDGSSRRAVEEETQNRGFNICAECAPRLPGWFVW